MKNDSVVTEVPSHGFPFSLLHIWVCWGNLLAHIFGFYRSSCISRVMDKPLNWAVTPSCLWWQHFSDFFFFFISRTKCKGRKIYLTHGFRGLGPFSVYPLAKNFTANQEAKGQTSLLAKEGKPWRCAPSLPLAQSHPLRSPQPPKIVPPSIENMIPCGAVHLQSIIKFRWPILIC